MHIIKEEDLIPASLLMCSFLVHLLCMYFPHHMPQQGDTFYIKVAIAVVIVLTRVFGVEITFTHDGTFPRSFLFDSSIAGIFIRHGGLE